MSGAPEPKGWHYAPGVDPSDPWVEITESDAIARLRSGRRVMPIVDGQAGTTTYLGRRHD